MSSPQEDAFLRGVFDKPAKEGILMPDDRLGQLAKNLKDDPPSQALDVETLTDAELARRRRGLEAMIESLEEVLTIDLKKLHEECAQQSGSQGLLERTLSGDPVRRRRRRRRMIGLTLNNDIVLPPSASSTVP